MGIQQFTGFNQDFLGMTRNFLVNQEKDIFKNYGTWYMSHILLFNWKLASVHFYYAKADQTSSVD